MASKYRKTEGSLRADVQRYKELAQPALRDRALEKLIVAGRRAAIEAVGTLEPDEREALEAALQTKVEQALSVGVNIAFGQEKLFLFVEKKSPKKGKRK